MGRIMISRILPSFRKDFQSLPKEIRKQAKKAYRIWASFISQFTLFQP